MYAQEHVALHAEIAVDAGTNLEKYTYLTNDLLQPLTTRGGGILFQRGPNKPDGTKFLAHKKGHVPKSWFQHHAGPLRLTGNNPFKLGKS